MKYKGFSFLYPVYIFLALAILPVSLFSVAVNTSGLAFLMDAVVYHNAFHETY